MTLHRSGCVDYRFASQLFVLTGLFFVVWGHAIFAPYWQDDFLFLVEARDARISGMSVFDQLVNLPEAGYWRPLGVQAYWRLLEGVFGGNVLVTHAFGVFLHLLSAVLVGCLCATFLVAIGRRDISKKGGLYGGFLYSIHPAHFVAVVWVAAANSTLSIIFSVLTLIALLISMVQGRGWKIWNILMPVFFALALLTRESVAVLPALGVILYLIVKPKRVSRALLVSALVSIAVLFLWLLTRQSMVGDVGEEYSPVLGLNVFRNIAGLFAFTIGIPREAVRFVVEQHSMAALLWALASSVFYVSVFALLARAGRNAVGREKSGLLMLFFLVGCAIYVILAWNCYGYYVSLSLVAYALFAALALSQGIRPAAVLGVAVLGSVLSLYVNYALPYPSLIGRANWAEDQLREINELLGTHAREVERRGLDVHVENRHKFFAIGPSGIAYTLGIRADKIRVRHDQDIARTDRFVLVVPDSGHAYLADSFPAFLSDTD